MWESNRGEQAIWGCCFSKLIQFVVRDLEATQKRVCGKCKTMLFVRCEKGIWDTQMRQCCAGVRPTRGLR